MQGKKCAVDPTPSTKDRGKLNSVPLLSCNRDDDSGSFGKIKHYKKFDFLRNEITQEHQELRPYIDVCGKEKNTV